MLTNLLTKNHVVFQSFILRLHWLISSIILLSSIFVAHANLLPFGDKVNKSVELVAIIVMTFTNSPIGKYNSPRNPA